MCDVENATVSANNECVSPFSMPALPLLITELERLARDRQLTIAELCDRLGMSPKTFYAVRAGDNSLSLDFLARVVREFESYQRIRDLALYFLAREYHEKGRPGCGRRTEGHGPRALPETIPYRERWRISAWVAHAARSTSLRRGLYISASTPGLLSAATQFVRRALEQRKVTPVFLASNTRLSASHTDAALQTQVLVVERVDHANTDVARLLMQRADALRTTVVTSCVDRERISDPHLVRMFRASMQAISLDPPSAGSEEATSSSTTAA
ncbi:MAG TPA: hypothetical protein VJ276_23755 [Thermoanaerobaculia bacterium]|nr:hypothetical protein [Thermoanaerobaculia bacterium]